MSTLTTMVVDDDSASCESLSELCDRHPDLELIRPFRCPREARKAILESRPDLVFLSVAMQPMSGLELGLSLHAEARPALVFVMPEDSHSINAFRLAALDYLVKPLRSDQFFDVVKRVRGRLLDPLSQCVTEVPTQEFLTIEIDEGVHLILTSDVEMVEADAHHVWITAGECYRVRATLREMAELLPRDRFLQVNRFTLVQTRRIRSIHRLPHGEYAIHLISGAIVTTSRRYRQRFSGKVLRGKSVAFGPRSPGCAGGYPLSGVTHNKET